VVSLLYGVRFNDPLQLAGAALTLAAAIALAAYLPARRAAQAIPWRHCGRNKTTTSALCLARSALHSGWRIYGGS